MKSFISFSFRFAFENGRLKFSTKDWMLIIFIASWKMFWNNARKGFFFSTPGRGRWRLGSVGQKYNVTQQKIYI